MLKNIYLNGSADPKDFSSINDKVVFSANSEATGVELFTTKGTTVSTKLLKDIFKVTNTLSSNPAMLASYNNRAYFFASGTGSNQLWKTDGKPSGTELIYDFGQGSKGGFGTMAVFKNKLYFTAASASTNGLQELWKSDGTTAGTALVYSGFTGQGSYTISGLTIVGNNLFFGADDGVHGKELWKTDGTTGGTIMVKDIHPNGSSSPDRFFVHNGICYFMANDNVHGPELWHSDGSGAGTYLLKDIDPSSTSGSYPSDYVSSPSDPDEFYFAAKTSSQGRELWKSDGTNNGTVMIKDINAGVNGSDPHDLTEFNGEVFFFASGPSPSGYAFWKTDGTSQGTTEVKDVFTIYASGYLAELTPFNGALYFSALNDDSKYSIWKTDGTTAGTVQALDFTSNFAIENLYVGGGLLFLSAWASGSGYELYQTDGTSAGTMLVEDQNPGKDGFFPSQFLFGNGSLLMTGTTEQYGNEIYVYTPPLRIPDDDLSEKNISFVAYPSPASTALTIGFKLMESSNVILQLTDISGKLVKTIFERHLTAGDHQIKFNRNNLDAGVYLLNLKSDDGVFTRKVILQ